MELGKLQKAWIKSLKKNGYRQCTGRLGVLIDKEKNEYQACCLGEALVIIRGGINNVLTDRHMIQDKDDREISSKYLKSYKKMGLVNSYGYYINTPIIINTFKYTSLAEANDAGVLWKDIAEYIEQNPENIFITSK